MATIVLLGRGKQPTSHIRSIIEKYCTNMAPADHARQRDGRCTREETNSCRQWFTVPIPIARWVIMNPGAATHVEETWEGPILASDLGHGLSCLAGVAGRGKTAENNSPLLRTPPAHSPQTSESMSLLTTARFNPSDFFPPAHQHTAAPTGDEMSVRSPLDYITQPLQRHA